MPLEADPGSDAAVVEGAVPAGSPPREPASSRPGDIGGVAPAAAGAARAEDPVAAPLASPDGDSWPAGGRGAVPAANSLDADEGDRALDPASVTAARLAGAIGMAVGTSFALAAVLVAAVATPLGGLAAASLGAAVLVLSAAGAAASWLWPAVRYRHIRYRLDAHGVTIRRGGVWRSVTSVPTSRVQHTDVVRGPVERYFDLATLVIHTAGTRDASVALSGLGHREAIVLRDRLIEAGGGRGV